ncbi:MAG: 6-hydroxymethylpterin diphosphokinase MptE-like protein [Candidatus Altiarchaeota archaeon]|nr:6-hydroxymethylpterin diphosphokinase MptE-like protein [Candidatus Altiarchaeota archaeon]
MDWFKKYDEIAAELELSRAADRAATILLDNLIEDSGVERLSVLLEDKRVIVFGAGPSLVDAVSYVKEKNLHDGYVFVAADGAVSAFIEAEVLPDVLVTDLDGRLRDILQANWRGSLTVVHAHGNNVALLENVVPRLNGVVGSTQVKPVGRVRNFGGFTDGDRCVFLAVHFKAREIWLAGMDFDSVVGEYSRSSDSERKRKKLLIAKNLIEELMKETDISIKALELK